MKSVQEHVPQPASQLSSGSSRVSLKDIADALGISPTAVSFAINDRPGVSAETKKRVKEAAAKLGWQPVYAAQALGSSKTMTVGFAPARFKQGLNEEAFMLHFMAGVQASLSLKGYGLLYRPCSSAKEELAVYRDWASRKRVDGVILVDLRVDDQRPKLMNALGLPAVLAGGPDPDNLVPSLSIDDSKTMDTILEHLRKMGHRRIAYLSGDPSLDYSRGREAAFRQFANKYGLDDIHIDYTYFDSSVASEMTLNLLQSPQPPTAFIYESETLAAESLHSITEWYVLDNYERTVQGVGELTGPRYPFNLPAIVSFEDSFVCEAAYPSITSVHRDASEYGSKIAKLLLKIFAGEKVSGNRKILTPSLVVRDSTSRTIN
ncbi:MULTISPECIES: LacI family DNA-binding transcriptional regulator [Bifidobacterium]|uniref:Regulatory protein, LacI n=1 Tax=Bifidobacterium reuteri DSM 23975 TaxID=1437610 RepID=A0A087CSL3_9BIFI|nr:MULTISPECIES: LacI family DNA-binding transcriptional regulator [Bifidobacterium]KFI86263.1 regulatory protein, LacI [Bifidobacterium reuteri DSM 23975]TPF78405.1 LacI family transcriptional regulator [Bifidobacterium sp. UTCIF-1]TPF81955.1 LacI family transcriptional regulator [Bifidobacterium sp. UTCIF-3]TPF91484.1 LacI family transcriptional regulator [Bifidobacterium sp. UTBIF-56]TPF94638.1 LacI family transcriptional regulator [Bifidobacterium sp. UTBIF-68]